MADGRRLPVPADIGTVTTFCNHLTGLGGYTRGPTTSPSLLSEFQVPNISLEQAGASESSKTGIDAPQLDGPEPQGLEWEKSDSFRAGSAKGSFRTLSAQNALPGIKAMKESIFGMLGIGVTDGLQYGSDLQYRLDYGEARVVEVCCGVVCCGAVLCGMVRCSVVRCGVPKALSQG